MDTSLEITATEAAELLGLTRERRRQLAAAGELPPRVAGSSPFRPRYRQAEIEMYGRATGRIVSEGPLEPMQMTVDEVVSGLEDHFAFVEASCVHLRVWERPGWPPVIVLGAPVDGGSGLPATSGGWEDLALGSRLADVRYRSLWVHLPYRAQPAFTSMSEYLERDMVTKPAALMSAQPPWVFRTHADLEAAVGGTVARYPGPLYTVDVIERVIRAGGKPVEVAADLWNATGLFDAVVALDEQAERETGEDQRIMAEAARFIAGRARGFDQAHRRAMPESTDAVLVRSVEFNAQTWEVIDRLAEQERQEPWDSDHDAVVADLTRRRDELRGLLGRRGDDLPWRFKQALDRAVRFLPPLLDE